MIKIRLMTDKEIKKIHTVQQDSLASARGLIQTPTVNVRSESN